MRESELEIRGVSVRIGKWLEGCKELSEGSQEDIPGGPEVEVGTKKVVDYFQLRSVEAG